jgi:amino acid transporter
MTVVPMIAATYFMVAGGPYGLEDIVQKTGYAATLLILLITPLVWSIPTAMMVSELATSIPEEGGFYVWVRRGLGPLMGYQETWLTMAGSVFEMALYPNLFVAYIGRFAPNMVVGHRGLALGFAMIAVCALWNVIGSRAVGDGSVLLNIALLAPFALLAVIAVSHPHSSARSLGAIPLRHADFLGGILIAMWNYMGWDNLSTIAGEVESPQKTYTRAMLGAVVLVVAGYLIPVAAVAQLGLDPNSWTTGGWVDVGRIVGGQALALAITIAGILGAVGSFGALMMSFTRLPVVMADDGFLPKVFTRRYARSGAPWVAVIACSLFWALCYPLGFERSLILDVLLTGLSILLEFWALSALRIREPGLHRPYRVPGGTIGTILIGLPPLALIVTALVRNSQESVGSTNELVIGALIVAAGFLMYFLTRIFNRARRSAEGAVPEALALAQEPVRAGRLERRSAAAKTRRP